MRHFTKHDILKSQYNRFTLECNWRILMAKLSAVGT